MPRRFQLFVIGIAAIAVVSGCNRDSREASATTSPAIAAQPAPAAPKEPASAAEVAPADQKEKAQDVAGRALEGLNALIAEAKASTDSKEEEPAKDALPAGFVPDGECADAPAESDAAGTDPAALVPLVEGLTLSQMWIPKAGDYEHECLVQITKIDAREISVTRSCPVSADRHMQVDHRRICRSDFANARIFAPVTSEHTPDVMGGTTFFSLSRASFRELKDAGETSHRYVAYKAGELRRNASGTLKREGPSTYRVIVNNRPVDLPVLGFSGTIGADHNLHPHGVILDDARFPLVLDYGWNDYSIRFTKISFPEASKLEASLEKERKVDVYGIYFDFASDAIRPESEPILKEIADVLARNAEWTLSINGHTDNIGGDKSNLDLSRRRSEAVRTALTGRYAIAPARLTTSGYGASQPKATNDTIEGRAQNRRVELIRQ